MLDMSDKVITLTADIQSGDFTFVVMFGNLFVHIPHVR